ncbi:MAG: hypothetical protein CM15mP55_3290 [Hyphomicrobiales bacterium]|nr:MAG: hypothetical protein CM15mP55_3290 [Hyphomicrobiales bacterium]
MAPATQTGRLTRLGLATINATNCASSVRAFRRQTVYASLCRAGSTEHQAVDVPSSHKRFPPSDPVFEVMKLMVNASTSSHLRALRTVSQFGMP